MEATTQEPVFPPATAPTNTALLCYGSTGWRFMRKRPSGQWENMMGHPAPAPKCWRPMPPKPEFQREKR